MAVSHAFTGFSLTAPRSVGPAPLPTGLSQFTVAFDTAGFTAGQVVWLSIDLSSDNGATWASYCLADFAGPWTDKQGHLQTLVSLTITLSVVTDGNWQLRGSLTPVNGPILIGAGSLVAA